MNYSFHDQAEKELEEIEKYYDDIRDELGDRFRDEIQLAITHSQTSPGLAADDQINPTL